MLSALQWIQRSHSRWDWRALRRLWIWSWWPPWLLSRNPLSGQQSRSFITEATPLRSLMHLLIWRVGWRVSVLLAILFIKCGNFISEVARSFTREKGWKVHSPCTDFSIHLYIQNQTSGHYTNFLSMKKLKSEWSEGTLTNQTPACLSHTGLSDFENPISFVDKLNYQLCAYEFWVKIGLFWNPRIIWTLDFFRHPSTKHSISFTPLMYYCFYHMPHTTESRWLAHSDYKWQPSALNCAWPVVETAAHYGIKDRPCFLYLDVPCRNQASLVLSHTKKTHLVSIATCIRRIPAPETHYYRSSFPWALTFLAVNVCSFDEGSCSGTWSLHETSQVGGKCTPLQDPHWTMLPTGNGRHGIGQWGQ